MVPLPDFSGYLFARRLDLVHQAFVTSRAALVGLISEQEERLAEYLEDVAAGMEPIERRDEDGHLLWHEDQLLEMRVADANEALQTIHKAIVISAYHVWEDATRRFTKKSNHAKHSDLIGALRARGIAAHEDLGWIVVLVNLLKHGNPTRGRELHRLRPDLFPPMFDPMRDRVDWYDVVQLSSDEVELVIERLGRSGPEWATQSHTGRV